MRSFDPPHELKAFLDTFDVTFERKKEQARLTVNADDKTLRNYLGTYFPRSFGQVRSVYHEIFSNSHVAAKLKLGEKINVFSFGIGTAGDVVGLIYALSKAIPNVSEINVLGIDANQQALSYADKILKKTQELTKLKINWGLSPIEISKEKTLAQITQSIEEKLWFFDFIQTHKACGELHTLGISQTPYYDFAIASSHILKSSGLLLISDVTIHSATSNDWYPMMLNDQLNYFERENPQFKTLFPLACNCYAKECHNHCYTSTMANNEKFCFRVLAKTDFVDSLQLVPHPRRFLVSDFGQTRFCQCSTNCNNLEVVDARKLS